MKLIIKTKDFALSSMKNKLLLKKPIFIDVPKGVKEDDPQEVVTVNGFYSTLKSSCI